MAKDIKRNNWDIKIVEAGPNDPIYKGGLRMNAVQKPTKSKEWTQKSSAGATQAEQSSAFPQEWRDQIFQEAKEQMGFQPEKEQPKSRQSDKTGNKTVPENWEPTKVKRPRQGGVNLWQEPLNPLTEI